MRRHPILVAVLAAACAAPPRDAASGGDAPPFWFRVVDAATGRGVPLVELETVHGVVFVTDNAGVAAVDEPGWTGCEVWFHVRSHGYELASDGFGFRGVRVTITPGASRRIELQRRNVAERLYRITGADRYRDSARVGLPPPAAALADPAGPPLGNGGVVGQDSAVNAVLDGRLYWFWGDTGRASYPLGNFATAGATSALPTRGGLDPAVGVVLDYFVDDAGFARRMCPIDGPGPVWIDGLVVLEPDDDPSLSAPTMVCHYSRMQDLGTRHEHGLARWNPRTGQFDRLLELPLDADLHARGHPLRVAAGDGGADWLYFCCPFPALRVRARLDALSRPEAYEAYTCLQPGARWDPAAPALQRDAQGRVQWAWRRGTAAVTALQWHELRERGDVGPDDGWMDLADVETGARVIAHAGQVCWNTRRQRWVMLFTEVRGTSMLGEVWYAEAPALEGPWRRARRVVTHDDYSFYNVKQHPWFAALDDRYVWFEGTYTRTFSGTRRGTPRYDYNQVMYRLDLDDPRLRAAFAP